MVDFILPYFETLPEFSKTVESVASGTDLTQKMGSIIELVDGVFPMAKGLSVEPVNEKSVSVRVIGGLAGYVPKELEKLNWMLNKHFAQFLRCSRKQQSISLERIISNWYLNVKGQKPKYWKKLTVCVL